MRGQIHSLTSLRFFAALSVVLFHFRDSFGSSFSLGIAANFVSRGYIWVDFFFVLSGFFIAYVYQDQFSGRSFRNYKRFIVNRIARIYPAHAFVVLLFLIWETLTYFLVKYFGLSALPFDGCMSAGTFFTNMLMVHDWGGWFGNCSWNYPAWSISSEWLAYLLFPFILVVLRVAKKGWSAAIACAAVYGVLFVLSLRTGLSLKDLYSSERVLAEFTIGILLYRIFLHSSGRIAHNLFDGLFFLALGAVVLGLHFGFPDVIILPFLAGTILFAALSGEGYVSKVFGARWLVFLGEASYSIYLVHAFDQRLWNSFVVRVIGGDLSPFAANSAFVAVMGGIILSGSLLHMIVERPARQWVRKIMG